MERNSVREYMYNLFLNIASLFGIMLLIIILRNNRPNDKYDQTFNAFALVLFGVYWLHVISLIAKYMKNDADANGIIAYSRYTAFVILSAFCMWYYMYNCEM